MKSNHKPWIYIKYIVKKNKIFGFFLLLFFESVNVNNNNVRGIIIYVLFRRAD